MKHLFIFAALLSCSFFCKAQSFRLIVFGGFNAAQVNGDNLSGFNKLGLYAGAGVSRMVNTKSGFQFDIAYSQKGSIDVVNSKNPIQDTLFRFNYVDIPVFYNYYFNPRLKAQLGLYTGVLTSASFDDGNVEYDRSSEIANFDYGVTGGVEYFFYDRFSVNLRMSQSVIDINTTFSTYYNLYSSFSVRYTFQ